MKNWDDLPEEMKNVYVKKYYDILSKKTTSLVCKRLFDLVAASILIVVLLPILFGICVAIKLDSRGPILFRQIRITQYGRQFKIFKFRTMVNNADKKGSQVTTKNDVRITKVGKVLRKFRLDELPQLFNIIIGDMTFVGTRPEVRKYVDNYSEEMRATLLLPAGVTSEASIKYKDEELLLETAVDADVTYINKILPDKMKFNLESIENYSFFNEILTMLKTVQAVIK